METDQHRSEFSMRTARLMAGLAQAAYLPGDEVPGQLIQGKKTDTQLFVLVEDDYVVVSFRGTQSLRDWLTDLDVDRVPFFCREDAEEVHSGFDHALDEISRQLDDAMAMVPISKPVYFTGHSLGGALAMLAASRWRQLSMREIGGVYTFGQPRVGNKAFKLWYEARLKAVTFRVVHAEDIVPRVPWLLGVYRHAGTEVFFDALNVPHVNLPWWKKGLSDVFGTWSEWRRNFTVAQIADHSMARYLEVLGVEPQRHGDTEAEDFSQKETKVTKEVA